MTGFNHGLTGAAIALIVKNPAVAIPLSFASHFLTDALPHWDYGTGRKNGKAGSNKFNQVLTADFILSIILMAVLGLLSPTHKWLIWTCMIAAASPDLAWSYYQYLKRGKKQYGMVSRFHDAVQWSETSGGIYIELAWFIIIGAVVLSLR